jgi:CRISPR/Cas system-associated protein endoribonuclease Cas2
MTVTEKQFAGIKLLVGPARFSEKREAQPNFCCFDRRPRWRLK